MKRTIQATIIGLVILAAGVAGATDTATVNVSATVLGTCMFSTASADLAFGVLPFDGAGNAVGIPLPGITATLDFWCTSGAAYTITDDDGANSVAPGVHRMIGGASGEFIEYGFSYLPAAGTGTGPVPTTPLTVTGTVGATYTLNSPDTYSDTVTLTINP